MAPPKNQYRKAIFIRDIRKTWYIDGINSNINTIEKIYEMLKVEVKGASEVICIGNSSGGYAATLFGILLGAHRIFSISGFFEIESESNYPENIALREANNNIEKSKWFHLRPLLMNSKIPLYFLYPKNCPLDRGQAKIAEQFHSVRSIAFGGKTHGLCAFPFNYPWLFISNQIDLDKLIKLNKNKLWTKLEFSIRLIGFYKTFIYLFNLNRKKIIKFFHALM